MKTKIILALLTLPLLAFAAVDIRVKKDTETTIQSNAPLFLPDELVNLRQVFTEAEIILAKNGLTLAGKSDMIFGKIARDQYVPDPDEDDSQYIAEILNAQVMGKTFSSDELKFLLGFSGETNDPADRIKYLAKRKLKEL